MTPSAGPAGGAVVAAGIPLLLRARYARDARSSPPGQRFDVTVQGEGPDGLLRVAVDDGVAGNAGARVFVTGPALAGALLAGTPASTAPSGDPASAGLAALLGAASVLSGFCEKGMVVVHGVRVAGAAGPGSPALILDVDYSVDILVKTITFGGLSIGMQDDVPMRVRYRQVRLEIDPAAGGLDMFHLSYANAAMDVEDPGRWRVPGAPFDVTGTRAGHGSTWFEVDLRFTLDLGPVKVSGATVRVTFDGGPVPDVTLRGLDAGLAVPGVIRGTGRLALAGSAFEAALAVSVESIGFDGSAYLRLEPTPAGTMVVLDLDADLPGAIPLGPTGLGLYAIGGTFGFDAAPDLAAGPGLFRRACPGRAAVTGLRLALGDGPGRGVLQTSLHAGPCWRWRRTCRDTTASTRSTTPRRCWASHGAPAHRAHPHRPGRTVDYCRGRRGTGGQPVRRDT